MDYVWWNKVTNASNFLDAIVCAVQDRHSIFLKLPDVVPWYSTMRDIISNDISMQNADSSFRIISDTGIEPGAYLLNEFCKKEKRALYRPNIGYANFLAKSDDIVLNDYILWIVAKNEEQSMKWVDFVVEYNKALAKNKKGCLFIIETRQNTNLSNKKGIVHIDYDKEIEYYDTYLFNMLAASTLKEGEILKKYLAEVVSAMLPKDIELAAQCILYGKKFLASPLEIIREIVENESRSDGTYFNVQVTEEEMQERLWEAQIKMIFPLIERHRNIIVHKYSKQLNILLPINAAYGETFTEVTDVELGTISYLLAINKIEMSSEDVNKVSKLKKARNELAHIKVVSQEDVEEILSFKYSK